jgi:hypothetical protein
VDKRLCIQVDYNFNEDCLVVHGTISEIDIQELLKLNLNVSNPNGNDTSWEVTATLKMGDIFLNNHCHQVNDPYTIKCNYFSRANIKKCENTPNLKLYEKNNIEIRFTEESESSLAVKSIAILIKIKLTENTKNSASFPVGPRLTCSTSSGAWRARSRAWSTSRRTTSSRTCTRS